MAKKIIFMFMYACLAVVVTIVGICAYEWFFVPAAREEVRQIIDRSGVASDSLKTKN